MKNEKSRVPKLRFKGFSGEWEEKYFGDISIIIMGQSPDSSSYNEKNIGLPLIQGNADCKNRRTSPRIYTTQITKECLIGDIIMTVRAPVGAVSKAIHNACIGRGVCAIRPKENGEFIYQFLIKYEDNWLKYSQGSTFTAVNSKDIRNLKITLPQKQEQEKISSFLSSIDKKINQLSKKDELLKNYKKAMMQKIFSQKLRFKKADGSDYPKWKELELKDILEVIDGDRGINYPKSIDFFENEYCLFLNAKNVTKNGFNFNDCLYITKEKDDLLSKGKLNKFDIVLTTRGSVGNFAYFDDCIPFDNIRINSGMVILRKKNQKVSQNYIYKLFGSMFIKNQIEKIAFGSAQPQLTVKEIKRFKINLPSLAEQTKIANFLSSLDTKISQNRKALEETQKFKKALLQKMFV